MSGAVPASLARLPALDALRAIGAAAVVGTHVGFTTGATGHGVTGGFLARLDVGVAIFFVLSGFLLFRPFAEASARGGKSPNMGRYLWRRAVRILPAYWVAVAACLLLLPQNRPAPSGDWIRYMTLGHIYFPNSNRHGLSQTWTLAVEAVFYLVLPIVVLLTVGRSWRPVRTVLVLTLGGLLVTVGWLVTIGVGVLDNTLHSAWLPTFAIWFAAGMVLAVVHVALRTGPGPSAWRVVDDLAAAPLTCCVIALGIFGVASTPITGPRDLIPATAVELGTRTILFTGVAAMVLIAAAFGPPNRFKSALASGPARWLGAISYGVFLWHLLVLEGLYVITDRHLFTGDLLGTYLSVLGGAVVLASISYYVLERPLLRWSAIWPRRRTRDDRQPEPANGQQYEGLGSRGPVLLVAGQRQPAGHQD
jgi:peptidoglycan/LPS O-acetylase OafA/YrhL